MLFVIFKYCSYFENCLFKCRVINYYLEFIFIVFVLIVLFFILFYFHFLLLFYVLFLFLFFLLGLRPKPIGPFSSQAQQRPNQVCTQPGQQGHASNLLSSPTQAISPAGTHTGQHGFLLARPMPCTAPTSLYACDAPVQAIPCSIDPYHQANPHVTQHQQMCLAT